MFEFDESERILRDQVSKFAKNRLAKGAKERAKKDTIDRDLWKEIGKMGYTALGLPEEYG